MATNKRKEAPALFELLDKSTLRVPKGNAGSLKIPSWWSNRNAPRTTAGPEESAPPEQAPVSGQAQKPPPNQAHNPPPVTPPFAGPVDFARLLPPANRWFVPVTILLLLLITLLVVHFVSSGGRQTVAAGHLPARLTVPTGSPKIGLMPVKGSTEHPVGGRQTSVPQPAPPPAAAQPGAGRVVPAADRRFKIHHWYLIIVTTQPPLAQKAAQFIARHGVDVSVQQDRNGYASVFSVRGFLKRDSPGARRFRQYVVQIGREVGQAQRTGHGAWDDAYYYYIHAQKKKK